MNSELKPCKFCIYSSIKSFKEPVDYCSFHARNINKGDKESTHNCDEYQEEPLYV